MTEFSAKLKNIKAVIFDMDGVIVDSEMINYHAMLEVLKPYNITFDFAYYSQFPGGSCIEAFAKTKRDFAKGGNDFDEVKIVDEFNNMRRVVAARDGWTNVPGAVDLVKYCSKKYKLALASGSAIDIIYDVTKSFSIDDLFGSMISGESIEHCKPSPDIFLQSAENIGVLPENCLVIEDSHNGILAANAAKMLSIGYVNPNSGNQDLSTADIVFDNMNNIMRLL